MGDYLSSMDIYERNYKCTSNSNLCLVDTKEI